MVDIRSKRPLAGLASQRDEPMVEPRTPSREEVARHYGGANATKRWTPQRPPAKPVEPVVSEQPLQEKPSEPVKTEPKPETKVASKPKHRAESNDDAAMRIPHVEDKQADVDLTPAGTQTEQNDDTVPSVSELMGRTNASTPQHVHVPGRQKPLSQFKRFPRSYINEIVKRYHLDGSLSQSDVVSGYVAGKLNVVDDECMSDGAREVFDVVREGEDSTQARIARSSDQTLKKLQKMSNRLDEQEAMLAFVIGQRFLNAFPDFDTSRDPTFRFPHGTQEVMDSIRTSFRDLHQRDVAKSGRIRPTR